jgi:hypothetical protein
VEEGVLSLRCIAADAGSYKESALVPAQNEAGNIHCKGSRAAEAAVAVTGNTSLKLLEEEFSYACLSRQQSGSLAVTGK